MRYSTIAASVALSAPLLFSIPALAATSTEEFVQKAAMSDMFEIQSGKLAADKAQRESVKSFGQRMADDHSKTTNELKQMVQGGNIDAQLPTALDEKHQEKLDKLTGLSGDQFDKRYMAMQVKAHQTAVDLFQDYSQNGDNDELKQWASNTLPTLKDHLQEAKTLDAELGKLASQEGQAATSGQQAQRTETRDSDQMATSGQQAQRTEGDRNRQAGQKRGKLDYVERQQPNDWTAEALIGRSVENTEGENLGEINNVIINERGEVVAVTIGVGGFLGLGEKDVGVPFDALDFRTGEAMANENATGSGQQTGQADQASQEREARFDTEHSDIRIVLNATRDQLEDAPTFVWLDQQDSGDGESALR